MPGRCRRLRLSTSCTNATLAAGEQRDGRARPDPRSLFSILASTEPAVGAVLGLIPLGAAHHHPRNEPACQLHPSDEPNGEVASLDLAVATGRGPDVLTDLAGLRPLVRDEDVALVGYRVLDDNDHFVGEHIRSTAITVIDLSEVRETGTGSALEKALATLTKPDLEGFWVHLDVDVLDDALMPAVDYRHPGGLTWQEAAQILGGLFASDRACGLEVTIFNPRLDPDARIAQRLSDLIANAVLRRPAGDGRSHRPRHP